MTSAEEIQKELEKYDYKVSTDTRKDIDGSVYFALKGESFNGNDFVQDALNKGAYKAVSDNPQNKGDHVYIVDDVLKTLQDVANLYRKKFNIPTIVIAGSNGKTTSKDLVRDVLKNKYITHATEGSFNNAVGVPLSILKMERNTEIAIFEVGANHIGEHTKLLTIIEPTHVVVTNNGMDHLEGFGSPEGVRTANKEIYNFAQSHKLETFVNKNLPDLMGDSVGLHRILYPDACVKNIESIFFTFEFDGKKYETHLTGNYNIENVYLALSIGSYFGVHTEKALSSICSYVPLNKRSQYITQGNTYFILDCYNANPTSMILSLESFISNTQHPQGIVLGDMLELGEYSLPEHIKIVQFVLAQKFHSVVFVGNEFKQALTHYPQGYLWFENSELAREWFLRQNFDGFTFLLKGSRGMKIERILE